MPTTVSYRIYRICESNAKWESFPTEHGRKFNSRTNIVLPDSLFVALIFIMFRLSS